MSESGEKLTPMQQRAQNRCFGCGPANPIGLHLEFFTTEHSSVLCVPEIPASFEGNAGYLHGGIIATLLDEAMSKSVRMCGYTCMTRHMEVDYQRPVPSSTPIRIEGRMTRSEGRKHWTEAKIMNTHGTVLAQGKGLFVEVTIERAKAWAAAKPPETWVED